MLARLNRRPHGFYGLERFGAIEAALTTGLQMETIRSSLPSDGTIPCMLTVLMISFAPLHQKTGRLIISVYLPYLLLCEGSWQ